MTAAPSATNAQSTAAPPGRDSRHDRLLIISAGMESSGSGWFFNMTNDLLVTSGRESVRDLRDRHDLHDILHHQNCSNSVLRGAELDRLLEVAQRDGSFVFKTHRKPTRAVRCAIRSGRARAMYIFRDPRDVVVSAFERGRKRRSRGKQRGFARLRTMPLTIAWMRLLLLPRYHAWRKCPGTLLVRYEDLRSDGVETMQRVCEHLGIDVPKDEIERIVASYEGENAREMTGAHYRAGGGRRRDALTPRQRRACEMLFKRSLRMMGYE